MSLSILWKHDNVIEGPTCFVSDLYVIDTPKYKTYCDIKTENHINRYFRKIHTRTI